MAADTVVPTVTVWALRIGFVLLLGLLATAWTIDQWKVERQDRADYDTLFVIWHLGGVRLERWPARADLPGPESYGKTWTELGELAEEASAVQVPSSLAIPSAEEVNTSKVVAGVIRVLFVVLFLWLGQGLLRLWRPPARVLQLTVVALVLHAMLVAASCWFVFGGAPGASQAWSHPESPWPGGCSIAVIFSAFAVSLALFGSAWMAARGSADYRVR